MKTILNKPDNNKVAALPYDTKMPANHQPVWLLIFIPFFWFCAISQNANAKEKQASEFYIPKPNIVNPILISPANNNYNCTTEKVDCNVRQITATV